LATSGDRNLAIDTLVGGGRSPLGQIPWPPPGRSRDRQRAAFMSATGQFLLALDTLVELRGLGPLTLCMPSPRMTEPLPAAPPGTRWSGLDEPAESRWVVGFEVILGAYSPLSIAAVSSLSRSGKSSAMDPSDR
jgi:hypothetical protein